ncbi:odorant receptor 4 isoform X1 [Galleria mellonella]|uniref:Odorant receptor n=1 Tax=Galleria mellonella TaxID=7137 RepID=A0A6J1X999_GALME|nr:odorant receptor 4 isoform X1 [Galleria mellonella]
MSEDTTIAEKEIHNTLFYCNFFIRNIGLSFIDEIPTTYARKIIVFSSFVVVFCFLVLLLLGQIIFIIILMVNSVSVEQFIGGSNLHVFGYGIMCFGKLLTLWYKKNTFRQVVKELADIWPIVETNPEVVIIKDNSLKTLRSREIAYIAWNVLGVWFFILTPVMLHLYRLARGTPSNLGLVWRLYYPFDATKPFIHEFVYVFEIISGFACVCCMLGSDIFFISMTNHISMLLRLLQDKIKSLGQEDERGSIIQPLDCYDEIVAVVQIHQRLIRYANDLEDAFSAVNLINVLLSSVNICCVMFNIVFLDPLMEVSNKLFLGAALTQMGIVCWYADEIYRASIGVSDAVYESGWYNCNIRCRRALLLMLQRSQRPLYFTALKFNTITLNTYRSVLTTSYSYFTLLYTSYRQD